MAAQRGFKQGAELGLDRLHFALEPGAVSVVAVVVPGVEEAACELESLLAEGFLGGEPFGVEAEVSLEVAPAGLAAFGDDVVVGPPAVGAADAGELLAEQFLEPVAVAVFGDPEYCVERVQALQREFQMGEFICYFNQGGLIDHAAVRRADRLRGARAAAVSGPSGCRRGYECNQSRRKTAVQ